MGFAQKDAVVITDITGPGPKAIHEPFSYTPDYEYDEKMIASIFQSSKGRITYLGDWHTHPGNPSYLSGRDQKTLRTIADYGPARLPEPVMLIFGTRPLELKVWRYKRRILKKVVELEVGLYEGGSKSHLRLKYGTDFF